MNTEKLNDWLQIVGMTGVIASLVFVGLEMRQTREIAISQIYHSRADSERSNYSEAISSSAFLSGMAKLSAGSTDSLTPEENVALTHHFMSLLVIWENDHFQYENGYLSDEHWTMTLKHMTCVFGAPFYREMLGMHFRESFGSVIQQLVDEAESDPQNCWPSADE
jgi:hypothetical protein